MTRPPTSNASVGLVMQPAMDLWVRLQEVGAAVVRLVSVAVVDMEAIPQTSELSSCHGAMGGEPPSCARVLVLSVAVRVDSGPQCTRHRGPLHTLEVECDLSES